MRICSLEIRDDVQQLNADVNWQLEVLRTLGRGARCAQPWNPVPVSRLHKPRKRRVEELCDVTAIAAHVDVPVFSERARNVLQPILGATAEWLPLAFDEAQYWLLNLLQVIDVLDVSKAHVRTLPNGRVLDIDTYAFKEELVSDQWLFKVVQHPFSVFATDRFRELVKVENLTGFFFQPVWDSDHAPFKPIPGRAEILTRPEIYGPEGFVPNVQELWPDEWKQRAREMKKRSGEAKVAR